MIDLTTDNIIVIVGICSSCQKEILATENHFIIEGKVYCEICYEQIFTERGEQP